MNFNKYKAAVHGCCLATLLISRRGSHTGFTVLQKSVWFFIINIFSVNNFKRSELKSEKWFGQWLNNLSEWLRNPGKGTLESWNQNISRRTMPPCQTSLEVRNRSVLILDPRLISIHFSTESFLLGYVIFHSKPAQSVCLLARTIWDITYFA